MLSNLLSGDSVNVNVNVEIDTTSTINIAAGIAVAGILIVVFQRFLTKYW
ncbi:hypothetical protein [Fibrella forsythiae]|uniref:Uncharacterized protein n=1 Tax=Fibrella forsythiae TaxID=2817061 RepID=A0ABS3JAH4_9BACT|nr:hypothetical protein [Fibrella forsythiae]MBO0946998.1 hypothetical protein [Fibrella forsythiae]